MGFDYRSVMSGKRRDPVAMLMRLGLRVASWPYRLGVRRRNQQFDSAKREIIRCGVPVISVGNLTTGGTGKTPIVCFLAKRLRERGLRVAIVSRGYGRGENDENDEAMELHARLPDVPHVQNPDRAEAARIAVEELEAEIILMDDGFQHRRLHRDLNIVVVDATCPFGYDHLLPRGLLREPVASLSRAEVVIISRSDCVHQDAIESIKAKVRSVNASLPIVISNHSPAALLEHPQQQKPVTELAGQNVAALCAIGNPDAFVQTVQNCGATVIESMTLPDHDRYSPETMATVQAWASQLDESIRLVICTHKDLVKISSDRIGGKPLAALMIELQLVSPPGPLDDLIRQSTDSVS
jgi:tetraacyldisaccharide 4'-kinase